MFGRPARGPRGSPVVQETVDEALNLDSDIGTGKATGSLHIFIEKTGFGDRCEC